MDLNPGQLSALTEMGITVWELRSEQPAQSFPAETELNSAEITAKILKYDWWVMVDQQTHNEQAERLLQAMLSAIGVSRQQFVIVADFQLAHIQSASFKPKTLLVLGPAPTQKLFGGDVLLDKLRGKPHHFLHPQLTTIISFGLDDLLRFPANKALAWQDLLLAKSLYDQWK